MSEGEDPNRLFAFTDAFETMDDLDILPVGLRKIKTFGLCNPIIEIDILSLSTTEEWIAILKKRIEWIKSNLGRESKYLVNFRDFHDSMRKRLKSLLEITYFLSSLPYPFKPFGLMMEEPTGSAFPTEVANMVSGKKKFLFLFLSKIRIIKRPLQSIAY